MNLRGKKVLLVGLGILGGGEAIARFCLSQGARLTITDLRNKNVLKPAIQKFKGKRVTFVLGKHRIADFKRSDLVVFNPAVSSTSPWVKQTKKLGKPAENDLSLFLEHMARQHPRPDYIAVTGTRGKTTTTFWINHLIEKSAIGGNIPQKGLLSLTTSKKSPFVLELSSFQLEFMRKGLPPPKVAIITNLYNDHLNRYGTLEAYAKQKAKIFLNQTKHDTLILNADDAYTKQFLQRKPKASIYYISLKKLPKEKSGLFAQGDDIYFQEGKNKKKIFQARGMAPHQLYNLLAALLAAHCYGVSWGVLQKNARSLPDVTFREELVIRTKHLRVINDSAATSPDATIAALRRFGGANTILITGGTDKSLDFSELAREITKRIQPHNLFLLEGSATKKLLEDLTKRRFFKTSDARTFSSLKTLLQSIPRANNQNTTILFSPASASFEKFRNEFDRGKKFNVLASKIFTHI